ncbi:hypothetical protein QBC37DRAFT_78950 [Rhypophila decipiens]|uniref:Uncharacterized protein n=1 Tax=Rhypophila decipiens TaxID=261697 RepID=A0AAN6XX93_9PEZI|nr:hypothetical protein QBC37DRAFT_78950 [Rhypophila decipiens]
MQYLPQLVGWIANGGDAMTLLTFCWHHPTGRLPLCEKEGRPPKRQPLKTLSVFAFPFLLLFAVLLTLPLPSTVLRARQPCWLCLILISLSSTLLPFFLLPSFRCTTATAAMDFPVRSRDTSRGPPSSIFTMRPLSPRALASSRRGTDTPVLFWVFSLWPICCALPQALFCEYRFCPRFHFATNNA